MSSKGKYFILNKKMDYERGFLEHMACGEEGFWVETEDVSRPGFFISRVLDSLEEELEWHRLVIRVNDDKDAPYGVFIYRSEQNWLRVGKQELSLDDFISSKEYSMAEKIDAMEPFLWKKQMGSNDILLHGCKGRYLWIIIEAYSQFGQQLTFRDIQFYFPKQTWLSYLPEIYQTSDTSGFLERYLAVFQTMFEDMHVQIRNSPYMIDPYSCDKEFLGELAKWISLSNYYMWSETKLRNLLKQAIHLYKMRGTREGILSFLKLYLEDEVYLVEPQKLKKMRENPYKKNIYENLYGKDGYVITILVKEESLKTVEEQKALKEMIYEVVPAQIEVKLVVLKPYIFLDGYSYLGVNSCLSSFGNIKLDSQTVIPFAVLE